MGLVLWSANISFLISVAICGTLAKGHHPRVFNVRRFGAVSDGRRDSSNAFLKAWHMACEWDGKARVVVPKGEFLVDSVTFMGPCKGTMVFLNKGVLRPPKFLKSDYGWLIFRHVDDLTVAGGTLDAQGYNAWAYNDCDVTPNCHSLPISMRFEFVSNGNINHMRSRDSRNAHISLFSCKNITMNKLKITAPENSPNTDGIKIGESRGIKILNSTIRTGDDCIAIISGSRDVEISNVRCGPGHGISVGSMGKYASVEDVVVGVTVRKCSFNNTMDGVRIKTWPSSVHGLAADFVFEDISMTNVNNPIVIDQQYCPLPHCDLQTPSHIQIRNITYNKIWGSSSSKIAVNLKCSQRFPCNKIVLKDIDLSFENKGPTSSSCSNVLGTSYGQQNPPACI